MNLAVSLVRRLAAGALSTWRALPEPVRRRFHLTLHASRDLARPYRVGRRKALREPGPIYCVGFHGAATGLAQGARLFSAGFRQAGFEVVDIDVDPYAPHRAIVPRRLGGGVVVSLINPPEMLRFADGPGARLLKQCWHVAYWAWELPEPPAAWSLALPYVDELWAPSRFTADALAKLPGAPKVKVAPYPLPPLDPVRRERTDGPVTVFFAFDLKSWMSRKNPEGAIAAFRLARDRMTCPARLLLKVSGGDVRPAAMETLRELIADDPNITVMTERLSASEMLDLVAASDIVMSLHRSEGFGLLLAEAMQAGVPVIATAWSSTLEFMDADSAILVKCHSVRAGPEAGDYAGGVWAEPDIEDAAAKLATLINDPDARRRLGEAGRLTVEDRLGMTRWLAEVASQLPVDLIRKT